MNKLQTLNPKKREHLKDSLHNRNLQGSYSMSLLLGVIEKLPEKEGTSSYFRENSPIIL